MLARLYLDQELQNDWLVYTFLNWLRNEFRNFDNKWITGAGVGKVFVQQRNKLNSAEKFLTTRIYVCFGMCKVFVQRYLEILAFCHSISLEFRDVFALFWELGENGR